MTAPTAERERAARDALMERLELAIGDVSAQLASLRGGGPTPEELELITGLDRVYVGRAMPAWHGRPCRVVTTWKGRGRHNVRIQFGDGTRAICPGRCLRKRKAGQ